MQERRTVIASEQVYALFLQLFLSTGPKSVVQGDVIAMATKRGGEKEDPERVEAPDRMDCSDEVDKMVAVFHIRHIPYINGP